MFEKVLVALDGSDHATKALETAAELGKKMGSEVRVVHVREMGFAGRAGQVPLQEHEEAQEIVDQAVKTLGTEGVKASGVMRAAQTTRVASEIAAEAREWGASGIVIGSRGLSGLEGVLIGSTTHKLLHIVDIPVVVVR